MLSVFGATCAVAGGAYVFTGQGVPCPFLALTGLLCPLCGSSRMGAAVLQGDLVGAWGWNPYLLLLGPILGLVWAWTGWRLLRGAPAGLPGPFRRVDRLSFLTLLALIGVPGLVFMIVRNLG